MYVSDKFSDQQSLFVVSAQDFLQAVQVYSNIEGGFGLLTAESRVVDTVDMSEWYEDPDFMNYMNPESK